MAKRSRAKRSDRLWGSDLIASAICAQNFPYICLTPGSSYRGLHDSIVNHSGSKAPKMVVALHEEHVIAIAQGYATVTDKPLVTFIHSNVGLMHATMGVFDAWCARQPVVIIGATGPVDATRRRPWIDWIHTTADQASLIRNYIKWDDQPGSAAAAVESIHRASMIARTRPYGPVYVNLDVSIQETPLDHLPQLHGPENYAPASMSEPSVEDLDRIIGWLKPASKVVVLAGRIGRDIESWKARIALAEALGAKVIIGNTPAAFPSTHPLFLAEFTETVPDEYKATLRNADVIVALDYVDLGGTLMQVFPAGVRRTTKIINCSLDHQLHNGWLMDYHVLPVTDLAIAATPEAFTNALLRRLKHRAHKKPSGKPKFRLPALPTGKGTIGITDLTSVFLNMTDSIDISLSSRPLGWPMNAVSISHPHDWIGELHGGGVGSGPGIAIGAALALRDLGSKRVPVAIVGDGDFTMGCNALWTASNLKLPLLIIVANNRSYFNDELHQAKVARIRRRPVENAWIGQRIDDPAPDMAAIARGFGLDGEGPVSDLADLPRAIERGLRAVKAGRSYVIDVVTRREYASSHVPDERTKT